ncbi:hypothetical protein EW145_g5275, partial [Phellinidium pouzarii]
EGVDLEVGGEAELGDADLAVEGDINWELCETLSVSTATNLGILVPTAKCHLPTKRALDKKKAQEQVKPVVNNPGNTFAITAPAAAAAANIATTSSATIKELPPTLISRSPLTLMMHFVNKNSLFDFLGEHGADYDINTMEMDHFDVNIDSIIYFLVVFVFYVAGWLIWAIKGYLYIEIASTPAVMMDGIMSQRLLVNIRERYLNTLYNEYDLSKTIMISQPQLAVIIYEEQL